MVVWKGLQAHLLTDGRVVLFTVRVAQQCQNPVSSNEVLERKALICDWPLQGLRFVELFLLFKVV